MYPDTEMCCVKQPVDAVALHNQLQNLQSVFASLNDGFVLLDSALTITFINEAANHILQAAYQQRCYPGELITTHIPVGKQSIFKKLLTAALENKPASLQVAVPQPGGNIIWLDYNLFATHNTFKVVTGVCAVIKDITAQKKLELEEIKRKQIEEKLYESRIQFEAFMEHAPIIAWITDVDGTVQYMNGTYRKMFNLTQHDCGKKMQELFPLSVAQHYDKDNQQVLQTGKPLEIIEKAILGNGKEATLKTTKFPIYINGTTLIAGWAIDITHQLRLQQSLTNTLEKYNYVSQATSDAIYDWDVAANRIYGGKSFKKLFGYTNEEISLKSKLSQVHPEDVKYVKALIFKSLRNSDTYKWSIEYRIQCADGTFKYVVDKARIIREDKNAIRVLGAMVDVTQLKTTNEKLLQQEKSKKRAIVRSIIETQEKERRHLSVELRDNVNQILSSCKLMLGVAVENKETHPFTHKSYKQLQLAIAEINRLSLSLNPSAIVDIGLIEAVEEFIHQINITHAVKMTFTYEGCKKKLLLNDDDKIATFRIIQEQVNNIIKHAHATEANVHLCLHHNTCSLTIKDNGQGFDVKQIKKGFGLKNITHRVEYYHGRLNIQTSPGQGCTMQIELPLK